MFTRFPWAWKVIYPLPEIMLLILAATIASAEDFVEIEEWGEEQLDFIRTLLPYEKGIPSHDALNDLVNALDPELFKACFTSWVETLRDTDPEIIAIDGKTSRRTHNRARGREPPHLVSAWAARQWLVLGQQAIDDKSNEIKAIPLLLDRLVLRGALVNGTLNLTRVWRCRQLEPDPSALCVSVPASGNTDASNLFFLCRFGFGEGDRRRYRIGQWPGQDASAPLVLEPVAFAGDLHDRRVVQDPIEHGGGEHGVGCERVIPAPEAEVRGQHQRALFVAPRHDLEEQVGLFAAERQITDLVDDQQLGCSHDPVHHLLDAPLSLRRFERDDQIGRRRKAHLPAPVRGQQAEGDRQMRLAGAARA